MQLWMAEDCWLQARLYLGLEHSPEQQDNESLCFSILVGHGQSHTFRVELATDLAIWEKSFQRAVFLEVQRIRVSVSACVCGEKGLFSLGGGDFATWIKAKFQSRTASHNTFPPKPQRFTSGICCLLE